MGVLHGNRDRVEPPGPNLAKSRDPLADPNASSKRIWWWLVADRGFLVGLLAWTRADCWWFSGQTSFHANSSSEPSRPEHWWCDKDNVSARQLFECALFFKEQYKACGLIGTRANSAILHYTDVIMTTIASQITSLTVVYSTVYSDADQRKHQSSASLAFVWGIHRDRWIPRTKGQLRGKCFHLMTSSWYITM